jgi:hypothetical protein
LKGPALTAKPLGRGNKVLRGALERRKRVSAQSPPPFPAHA